MLCQVSSTLETLDLGAVTIILPGGNLHWNHYTDDYFDPERQTGLDYMFCLIFADLTFPKLLHLTLRGFIFDMYELCETLENNPTLRELRLFDNIIDTERDIYMADLLRFANDTLQLHGVEVRNYNDRDHELSLAEHFIEMRQDAQPPRDLTELRRQIDQALLGGRHNLLQQTYDCSLAPPINPNDPDWWRKPRYW